MRTFAITGIDWASPGKDERTPLLVETCRQLQAYFHNELGEFDLPLAPAGSDFQQRVYVAILEIGWGRTKTYGQLAKLVDTSAQAVGWACGSNPIPIIIPCHRVVAVGALGGYSGAHGIETKVALLRLEGGYALLL